MDKERCQTSPGQSCSFLDKFASFPRLDCETAVRNPLLRNGKISSIIREYNPASLGLQSETLTFARWPYAQAVLETTQ
jgi:hypothetical protein